ncbi:thiol-activated cytolysin family protein [Streptomyces halobius]|uniref:Thiol-activated cytolysin family protein n=1 Tax=Streptomyces halobius TaxID=2879846 RepID=A0ABY4M730_9ACTN|nr:thiol-activated cytolysin family protein [Streptomyces halobius]UQA92051.1 thiol-activated cytolysin family protein [Streptomyces halobius]
MAEHDNGGPVWAREGDQGLRVVPEALPATGTGRSATGTGPWELWWIPAEGLPELVSEGSSGGGEIVDPDYGTRGPGEYVLVSFARSGDPDQVKDVLPGQPKDPVDFGDFLSTLRKWEHIAPQKPDEQRQHGKTQVTHITTDKGYVVEVRKTYSLTRTPGDIITFNPNAEGLWPGALVSGQTAKNGLLREIGITGEQRNPVRITIDNLAAKPSEVVSQPDTGTVTDAIKRMVQGVSGGHRSQVFHMREAFSDEEIALNFGFSASYSGFSSSTKIEASRKQQKNTIVAYLKESAFTASCDTNRLPNAWMNEAFTYQVLEELKKYGRIGVDNPPLVVASVTYGRILMFTFTSSESITDITAALNFGYSGAAQVDAELEAKYKKINREAEINLINIGGSAQPIHDLLQSRKLADYFNQLPSLADYSPMGFVLKTLDTNIPARMSETTTYDDIRYEPARFDLKLEILGLSEPPVRKYWLTLDGKRSYFDEDGSIFPPLEARHRFGAEGEGDPFRVELWRTWNGQDYHMGDAAYVPDLHRIADESEYTVTEELPFAFKTKTLGLKFRLRVTNLAYGNGRGGGARKTDLERFEDILKRLPGVVSREEYRAVYDQALDFIVYESQKSSANTVIMATRLRDKAYDAVANRPDKAKYHQEVAAANEARYASDAFRKGFMAGTRPADRREHGLHVLAALYNLEAATVPGHDYTAALNHLRAGVRATDLPDGAVRVKTPSAVFVFEGEGATTVLVIGEAR